MWKQEPVSHTKFCFKGMCSQDTSLSINSPLVFPKQMSVWYGTLGQGSKFLGPNPGAGSDHRCALGRIMKTCWDPTSSAFKGPGWLVRETQVQVHLHHFLATWPWTGHWSSWSLMSHLETWDEPTSQGCPRAETWHGRKGSALTLSLQL